MESFWSENTSSLYRTNLVHSDLAQPFKIKIEKNVIAAKKQNFLILFYFLKTLKQINFLYSLPPLPSHKKKKKLDHLKELIIRPTKFLILSLQNKFLGWFEWRDSLLYPKKSFYACSKKSLKLFVLDVLF